MMIPFDIKYREEIESGKYKTVAHNGQPVRIICWDARNYWDTPIIGLYNNGEVDVIIKYNIHGASGNNETCLWIETGEPEDETTRKQLLDFLEQLHSQGTNMDFDVWSKADCANWILWVEKQKDKTK